MTTRLKHPRTPHLSNSPGIGPDDVFCDTVPFKPGDPVVISEKMDGEGATIYHDGYVHARSTDSGHHPSRSWVKQFANTFAHELPTGWRISGENLYAFHSILYTELPTYFFVFAIYNHDNYSLPWGEVEAYCAMLGLTTVPVIYRGVWSEETVRSSWSGKGAFPTFGLKDGAEGTQFPDDFAPCEAEGYVVRHAAGFRHDDFGSHVLKWVRQGHVQTDSHWMSRSITPNRLKLPG